MAKYEILLMLDPKQDQMVVSSLIKEVFAKPAEKVEKLPITELAYEINKSTTAQYILVHVSASGDEVKEFRRKANILKTIWRYLVINLDNEKGLTKKPKSKYEKWAEAREQERRDAFEAKMAQRRAERNEKLERIQKAVQKTVDKKVEETKQAQEK
ncbi:30S ribosomal protein S6 [Mycoplasmopsis californica]|uniref:Small ribosomal subunit protein bS6 n=1 Tax=Mycoplasmopsis equigenitalium TaxID=114883 RepID=A0ABY5J4N3_9BACT|nr:30S ribosomal protein S6 [Mycoplasmopsis equigenitalium]UUD36846.1 30S ribosomal protein S6 [Mycoplasmopsis equigenitalium]VEU69858.1 30S ribosomal protein S6 [Mycoplasmopsis californica]